MKQTRTHATTAAYLRRAQHLVARMVAELQPPDIDPMAVAQWAISLRPQFRRPTWRQYKSSLICYFEQFEDEDSEQAIALLTASDCSNCLKGKDAPARTSSFKKRCITPEELSRILEYISTHKTRWGQATAVWLQAAVLTGLRPGEWQTAVLNTDANGNPILIVRNAKNTNGRAHGSERTLLLNSMAKSDIKIIQEQVRVASKIVEMRLWDRYYRECRKTLYAAVRVLWPRRSHYPTLYTGRHQFAADAKWAGLTKSEVAALMGHASSGTAGRHYGKKRSGRAGFAVRACIEEVARVNVKNTDYNKITHRPD